MRANQVKVSNFEFITIKNMEVDREVGQHGKAKITGYISDERANEYRRKLLEDLWITVTAADENGKTSLIMAGVIGGFSLDQQPHVNVLTLEIMSGTYLMDGIPHFRTFQNESNTYIDIMDTINESYKSAGVVGEESVYSPAGDFVLQYKETDWEFVSRLVSQLGLVVTPAIVREGAFYYIGEMQHVSHTVDTDVKYSMKKRVGTFMQQGANGIGTMNELDYVEYSFTTREIYGLWDDVYFGGKSGNIYKIHSEYVKEELVNTYYIRPSSVMRTICTYNYAQTGSSFEATVTNVKQDMVQVEVKGDENSRQSVTKWFRYSTGYSSPDGPGFYCMPEVEDHVRLQIPNEQAENAYVISSVHMETSSDRKNPDHKSMKTKYGKELLFTPDSISLTNNQGLKIELIDSEGIKITSNKNITIQAAGDMTLSSENGSLMVAGTESVDVKQGGTSVHLDDNIAFTGGKFRIQ